MHDDSHDLAVRHDFLARYADDAAAGTTRSLADYQALFPGHEAAIAEEFAALSEPEQQPEGLRRIGPYELLRELGRGGQATVYLARDVRLGREVALKLLPRDLASVEQELRLRREAQTASRWHDPCICEVFDVGQDGAHLYVTMRHVPGETLAARIARTRETHGPGQTVALRADRGPAAVDELLEVFERLARSLHRAHVDGVVHRDVKPGNVMITPAGEPVLLDFGLALDTTSDQPTLTRTGERFGTPAYMAPEQIAGTARDADARCDVYALGVSLYEAATLVRPFTAPTIDALYLEILHQEPPDPRRSNPTLSRDFAVLLQTAMAKEPSRRYQSALDLAEDLARLRQDQSIRARPAGPLLRVWRWRRRHPAWSVALVLAVLALVGFAIQQTRAVAAITLARDEAEAVNDFLIQEMLLGVTPAQARGRELTVAEVFDRAADRVDAAFPDDSLTGAAVRHLLGSANASLSRFQEARRFLEQAARIRKELLGPEDPRTLDTEVRLARSLLALDELDAAERLATQAHARLVATAGPDAETTLAAEQALMEIDSAAGRYAEALDRARATQERARRTLGDGHPRTLALGEQIARSLTRLGRRDEAEPILRNLLAQYEAHGDPSDPDHQDAMMSLASLLHDRALLSRATADWDAAEQLYRRALEHAERIYGTRHRSYSIALNNLGQLLKDRGAAAQDQAILEQAAELLQSSLDLRRALFGDDHSLVTTAIENLGGVHYARNDFAAAEPLMQQGYERCRKLLGETHDRTINALLNLATCVLKGGAAERALPLYDALLPPAAANASIDDTWLGRAHYFRGTCLRELGRSREAVEALETAWNLFVGAHGENHRTSHVAARTLAELHESLGETDAAARWWARVGD